METTAPTDPLILVLAEGDSPGAVSAARGRLFEEFAGRLLELYGYEEPHRDRLNVSSDGIELDVSVTHRLNGHRAIAECKAHSTPVAAHHVSSFYGKLCKGQRAEKNLHGYFVAIPRLSPQAADFVEDIEGDGFTVLTARQIRDRLLERGQLPEFITAGRFITDRAIVVTRYGLFIAGKENDVRSRTAAQVLVQGMEGAVPASAIELLALTSYAQGLPIVDEAKPTRSALSGTDEPLIAPVHGSQSNFEYKLPASPQFFVGRKLAIQSFEEAIRRAPSVIVLNAQSGWGKSSLALRVASSVAKLGGHAKVIDSRTAISRRGYVNAALKRAAEEAVAAGLLELPASASWASISSGISTIAHATWLRPGPLLIFFDQFENVFRDVELTTDFRDLALLVAETSKPFVVAFAWKTDYIGWTESHPYNLRDDIRGVSQIVDLGRLGPREVELLLRRLEKELGDKLSRELRRGLQEISLGLPWLFKKLTAHVLAEIRKGVTQEQLVSQSLNAQSLFEADLAGLGAQELDALKFIARYAPISVGEVTERVSHEIVLSLVHQRLIVQIGEKYDTYWDTFRDFLNTGRVPIEDSYIIRYAPVSVSRLLTHILKDGGVSVIQDVALREQTSENSIWNIARELRVLGASRYEPYRVRLIPEIWENSDREAALRMRVTTSLRRHRALSTLRQLAERSNNQVTLAAYATALRSAFSTVGTQQTWKTYARAFVQWFEYAGLARMNNQTISVLPDESSGVGRLFEARHTVRIRGAFPYEHPNQCIRLLRRIMHERVAIDDLQGRERRAFRELVALGAVASESDQFIRITWTDLIENGRINEERLLGLLTAVPGGSEAISLLRRNPAATPKEVGEELRKANAADWQSETMRSSGVSFRAWARLAGLDTSLRSRPSLGADGASGMHFEC
ncbi:restriction endonuclease [Micromonospora sp. DT4]|uniref:nSTAND1 domain-containing NTPase n=1 Tax=Micromonospora sp. DT4 TaxID=3393438 RepID=UPI003CF14EE5